MRVLLFGASGQVGQAVRAALGPDVEVYGPASRDVPLTSAEAILDTIADFAPDAIVNAAAYTNVDGAESDEIRAIAVNATAPDVMAKAARERGARLVHFSTDYVFDGSGVPPYATDALPAPLNVYGATKLAGERAVLASDPGAAVIRTAWVHCGSGTNFVGTAVRLLAAGTSMRVVDDQVSAPTSASTLARATCLILVDPVVSGLLHVTDSGVASWYDVACCVRETLQALEHLPADTLVEPVDSSAFPRPARRPFVSLLRTRESCRRLHWTPPHWRAGVVTSTTHWVKSLLHA